MQKRKLSPQLRRDLKVLAALTAAILILGYFSYQTAAEIENRKDLIAELIHEEKMRKIQQLQLQWRNEKRKADRARSIEKQLTFPGIIEDWGVPPEALKTPQKRLSAKEQIQQELQKLGISLTDDKNLTPLETIQNSVVKVAPIAPQPPKVNPEPAKPNRGPQNKPLQAGPKKPPPNTNKPAPQQKKPLQQTNGGIHPGSRAGIQKDRADKSLKNLQLKNLPMSSELAQEDKKYYEDKYHISKYKEMPICVVVPSYNNAAKDRYFHNMNSILQQDYSNYRIIFIDDASDDRTGELIKQYAANRQIPESKMKIVINQERKMAMPNLHWAATEFCKPYEIFMIIDGDDELIGKQVFKHFSSIFQQKSQLWLAYTNFITVRGSIGYSRPYSPVTIEKNTYRHAGFIISHLRAFYTKLFTLVDIKDMQDEEGKWFRAANDVAMYLPMMEMCHKRLAYIPEVSYMYNSNTGLNNHRVKLKEQKGNERKVKAKRAYKELSELLTEQEKKQLEASMDVKIPLKDPSLPVVKVDKKLAWEIDWENHQIG